MFEPNQGQAEAGVRFLARGRGYGLFLSPTESVLVLASPRPASSIAQRPRPVEALPPAVVRMRLVGADAGATISGVDPLPGRNHYLVGDRSQWRRDVPTFARVRYADVYPGVSLVFYGTDRQLEYDFVVAPGADPSAVTLAFDGADVLRLDDGGDLVLATAAGEVRLRRPLIYQETDGERRPVEGGYVVADGRVRFHVAAWDASRPLVIDPVLGYSTYLGGSSNDQGFGIAVDTDGSAYITGSTISSNFPVFPISPPPVQTSRGGVTDAFITKLDPVGSQIVYSTYLGGSGDDAGNAIAVDLNGNAFVAGTTNSTNFPLQFPFQTTLRGLNDAFVAKLDPTGTTLLYSTYIGSNTEDVANGIAIDALGNAYITGSTASPNFPNNNAVICLGTKSTGADAYVVRLSVAGDVIDYCRFIGGTGTDVGQGIAADAAGDVWVVGSTSAGLLGTVNPLRPYAGGLDAFVGKLDPLGNIVYLTHLGGTADDEAFAVAVDISGNAYVAGSTTSFNFPVASPFQAVRGGIQVGQHDAFVTKLSPTGSTLVFSTYLGGTGDDIANGIAVNVADSTVYVVGSTQSVDFPQVQALQPFGGRTDAFITKLAASGASLVYSTFLGGTGDDVAQAVAVDLDGVAYLTGATNSLTFPTQDPIRTAAGVLDAFVTQIADGGIIQFTAASFQVDETASNAVISLQRTGDTSGQVTVDFLTSDGTATAGADYTAVQTTLTFVPGQIVQTINVPILDDVIGDGDETVVLTLRNPTGGAVLGLRRVVNLTILDNEPAVNFTKDTFTVAEGKGPAIISVNRSGPANGTVLVDFSTADDTAIAGQDYTAVTKTLTFAPGVRTQLVSVPILQDTAAEGTETVNLRLLNVRGGTPPALLGVRSTAVLQITDEDDKGGNLQFSQPVYSVKEPGPGQTASAVITVTRTGGSASGVMVDFQATDGPAPNGALAGTNYAATAGTLTFAAGQTTATFTVPILSDASVPRGNPLTVALSLTNLRGGGAPGTPTTATLNIEEFQANVAFTGNTFAVVQSATSAPITVRRSGGSAGTVTVSYSTTTENTTAVPDVDFRPVSGTLTFPASNTTLTFSVPILNNPNASGQRTVGLALAAGTGVATIVEPRTAVLNIGQAAAAGAIEFASSTFEAAENVAGGLATIGVIRSGGTLGGVTVAYATSDVGACPAPAGAFYACAGSDYTATSGTLTFGQGETFKTFTVPILNDALVEGVESLNLTLSTPGPIDSGVRLGVRSSAQLKIVDDELALGFSATTYTVAEAGGSISVKVELTGVSATPVTVHYATSDGTATAGQDYVATSGTLTFPPPGTAIGIRTQTFTIPILPDTLAEGTETINVTLSSPTGGAQLIAGRASAVVSITDDDQGGIIEFDAPTFSEVEGAGVATIRVKRSAAPGGGPLASGVTVDYATSDGTATAGVDYTATAGRLTFAAGETLKTFTIPLIDDTLGEGDETVNLRLVSAGGGGTLGGAITAVLTIVDDDPYVTFGAPTYSVVESTGTLSVTVNRGGSTAGQVTVDFTTADQRPGGPGKAVGGVDYTPVSGTLTFAPGAALATFQVPILNNAQPDADRKFDLLLRNATPGSVTILSPARAQVTITDDDAGGLVQFSAPTYTVSETGGDAVVTLIRTGGSGGGVSVLIETGAFATTPIAPTATASVDYTPLMTGATSGRRVTFGIGETTKTVRIPIVADAVAEGVEQFDVKLSGPCVGAVDPVTLACVNTSVPGAPTIGPQSIAAVLIVDAQQTVQFSAAEFTTPENAPAATLVVERTGPSHRLLVDFNTADLPGVCPAPAGSGRACAGVDYRAATGTLTFEPGVNQQRISVQLIDNVAVDKEKLFSVQLTNLRSSDGPPVVPAATLGPRASANVRVKDDDRGGAFSVTGGSLQETNGTTSFTVTISRAGGTGGPVSVFFHARQCGAALPTTLPATPPQFATACDFVAREGIDFDPLDERIVFLPGETSKTRTIVVHGNAIPEGSRDIRVQLTEPLTGTGPGVPSVMQDNAEIGATLAGAEQLVTITEDDLYFVSLSTDSYSVAEGAREALITVIRSGLPSFLSKPQDIDIIAVTSGTGLTVPVAGLDYVDLGPSPDGGGRHVVARENPFRFNANETSKVFRVPLLDDTIVDGPKEFAVYIRSAVGRGTPSGPGPADPQGATLTVNDDDAGGTIEFSSAEYVVAENVASGFATITVARTGGLAGQVTVQADTVDMSGPGTPIEVAVPGTDYTPVAGATVTFNAGESTATFVVPILNDGVADGVKTVNLQISNPQPAGFAGSPIIGPRSTAMLHIIDTTQTVAFAHDNYTVDEGAGTAAITLERTGSLAGVLTVNFDTSNNTAFAGIDYTTVSGAVTFPAGVSQVTVAVPIIDNTTVAPDKTLGLALSAPSAGVIPPGRGAAILTIKDDDKAGTLAFPSPGFIVQENGGPAIITIARTDGTAGCPLPLTVPTPPGGSCLEPTLVTFNTADGTATQPGDYTAVTTTVEFGAGETLKTVAVPIVSDGPGEGTETVNLVLSNPLPTGAGVTGRGPTLGLAAAMLSIIETEFRVGATAYTFGEGGGPAIITVVRVGDVSGPATLDFVTVDGTAVSSVGGDFTGVTSGQITFAAQEAVKTLSVTLSDDSIAESDESFDIVFSNPVGATIARDSCATALPALPALVTSCTISVNVLDNEIGGTITFGQPVFDVPEPATPTATATITVRRTAGGAAGVTVDFATGDDTALAGQDYDAAAGTLSFGLGETVKTFTVTVRNGVLGVRAANLFLQNATGG
ncbi:MAG TPA: Calx-beta domain-containing protein, partial [Candidatus Binatia bacterium]|nr:Calx-beta domain-containing protein [Candidatus Binatia bacterium]